MSEDFDLTEWLHSDSSDQTNSELAPKEPTLTTSEIKILSFVEQTFWATGELPTPEAVAESCNNNVRTVRQAFANETFRNQIAQRGMDPDELITVGTLVKGKASVLSAKQILCANMMLNLHDKRSEREKLQVLDISSQQYHAWLRQPQFVEFLRKRGEALFSASDFKAYKALVNNVAAGDNKSLELFFRMRGIYNPTVNINLNIEAVLTRVIEVIATHVKDPHIIQAIANDIDVIMEAEEVA
jgi:hypothetical protein